MKVARQALGVAVVLFGAVLAVGHLASCAVFTKPNARTVLDIVQIACAIERASLGDAEVAMACGIADALLPDLRALLAAQRAALAKAQRAGTCRDGGPDGSP